ncbi:DUF177 domain-containing protein [Emcibacter sp. SYSU 3D8]|uniref:YceD family protein n=1 Tax=Emcibacter sp. SYSU 3D8 TaxID=3133969 RepID=UPI0031FEAF10
MTESNRPELHRPFDIVSLPDGGRHIEISPSDAERDAIARRLDLLAVADFAVRGRLDPLRRGRSAIFNGRMTAALTQRCIITGDPVDAAIDEEIHVRLLTEDESDKRTEVEIDADEDDLEIAEEGIVDLGEICVQYLAIALDPYPRAPGAQAPALPEEVDSADVVKPNPFAVLKKLKDKT